MRIWIQVIKMMRIHANPDAVPDQQNNVIKIESEPLVRGRESRTYPAVKGRVSWAAVSVTPSSMSERRQPVSGFMRIRIRFRNNTDLNRIQTISPRSGKTYPAVNGRVSWAAVSVTPSSMRERRQPVSGFMRIRIRFRIHNTD